MQLTASLARQLQRLGGTHDSNDLLLTGLHRLSVDLAVAVPSLLSVSLVLTRRGVQIPFTVLADNAAAAAVHASAALALPPALEDHLLLQAGTRGAFLLLLDELEAVPSTGLALVLDQHLHSATTPTDRSLAAALADVTSIDQAVGVLLERGLLPAAALTELRRRAGMSGSSSLSDASRSILAGLLAR